MDEFNKFMDARAANGRAPNGKRWSKFQLVLFDVLKPSNDRPYLVKGLIPRVGLVVVWGPPKCGKSFWTFDALMHVALDWLYRGRRVQQGPVVYCAFEGADGFKARAEAFRQRHLSEDHGSVPFYLMPTRANLPVEHPELIRAIEAEEIAPVAVVLDTLNRSLDGEENDKNMGAYVKAADAIREAFNCAVIIVHHCGVEGTRPRGHSSLTGAADAQLKVERDPAGNIEVTVEYMKDGPDGDIIVSRLEQVTVGEDEDGDPITSCIVVPAEAPAKPANEPRLTKNQKTMFSILHDAGPGGLTVGEWNERGNAAGIGKSRHADYYDARSALKKKGLIREYGGRWNVC